MPLGVWLPLLRRANAVSGCCSDGASDGSAWIVFVRLASAPVSALIGADSAATRAPPGLFWVLWHIGKAPRRRAMLSILAAFVGLLHAPMHPRAVAMRRTAPVAAVNSPTNRFGGTPLRPDDDVTDDVLEPLRPVELQGGWEVRTDRSGMEETWFELFEDGSLETSRSGFGRGRMWRAEKRAGGWHLIVTVEDKLKRPLTFDGRVREDEYVRLSFTGSLMAPSKKTGKPITVGEFRAWPRSV